MSAPRSISVLMPTFQGAQFLERVLEALSRQRCATPWDFAAVDSGSTDGTWELLERWRSRFPAPFELRRIHPLEFDHGDTRNSLAAESRGELLVFLTQDAIPTSADWLERLAANFGAPEVGAAYCRNVPRPDAELLTVVFSANDPGYGPERREVRLPPDYASLDPHARRLLYNFNDVASAVRRELWQRHPFPRTRFGEDLLMARALLEAGCTVVYDAEATVEHSHDYGPAEMRARAEIDGRFNAEHLGRICVASLDDARVLVERQLERDRAALVEAGVGEPELGRELGRAAELRRAAFEGLYQGGRSPRRRPASALARGGPLSLLYVVHGFPPDTWAGTEVYTLELAREMRRRGHRVAVLARAPLGDGREPWTLREECFEGLRVLRVPTDIDYKRVRDSYSSARAEELFRGLLERERPDAVHFQHLIHLSAGLPRVTRELGIPSVLTCNDYWGLCSRVQLIRPDGERCEENQGMGCYWCLMTRAPAGVPAARRWLGAATPALRGARAGLALFGVDLDGLLPKPGPPGSKLGRRLQNLDAVRRRQELVLGGYAAADLWIAPSRFLREKYLATGAFDPERFVYSDYGLRPVEPSAARRADPTGRVRFAFVGSLLWYKGVDVLVRAFARLDPARASLAIHGAFDPARDAYHAELERIAAGRVSFRGQFANGSLAAIHAEIDVLVVPSVWFENSPITIHEAFQFGTPVVTSDIGGMAELVEHGRTGLLFRAGDADDLARALARLVDEPGLLAELSRSFPRVKSMAENAREMEFRYRSLTTLARPVPGGR
jgi:glycosyltransferase involved in cell wall biosynthesis/GT2 family glycosyltransferase